MPEWAEIIGGFIRWLLKGCKTKIIDEVEGNFDPKWGGNYDFENFIIGVVTVVILLGILLIFFLK